MVIFILLREWWGEGDGGGFLQYNLLTLQDVDPNAISSCLKDNVLTVKAPKLALPETQERTIPITYEKTSS